MTAISESDAMALQVTDVTKHYDSGFTLDDVTFDLPKGYIMGRWMLSQVSGYFRSWWCTERQETYPGSFPRHADEADARHRIEP